MTRRRAQLGFEALAIEGGLLTPDFLVAIAGLEAPRQSPTDYRVPRGIQARDEIGRAWRIAEAHWQDVESAVAAGGSVARPMTAILRDAFGWSSLSTATGPRMMNHRAFPISAFALGETVPVVLASPSIDLDKATAEFGDGQKRRSAFGLVQEYLNASSASFWGVTTNGLALRITRDNASLTRPAWIEADLARIMREERYADFSGLWLLLHESRFGATGSPAHECPLEAWRAASAAAGTAARDRLRAGVEAALRELGAGFLKHPGNDSLRERLQSGALDPAGYQQQLLRLVYRLIFLLVAEERDLLHPDGSEPAVRELYRDGYSLGRLRERAARRRAHDRHDDVWAGLQVVWRACARGEARLGIPALGGLFAEHQTPDLDSARIANRFLLSAVYRLTWLEERDTLVRVNWRDMGTEELGSVYESLLELVPVVRDDARHFGFMGDTLPGEGRAERQTRGHARKLTGSYYTPDSLVQALLDSALDPVAQRAESASDPERAILSLAILDPACGSGHFLLGAARRLASRLARVRSDGTPSPAAYRTALRDVITHCIYGVDKNAMAIELARIALWLEAIDPGRPLAFLDHHLVHGDAILGVMDPSPLEQGIPDEAFSPLTGDSKDVAKELKKRNAHTRKQLERERADGQFVLTFATDEWARRLTAVDAMSDGSLDAVAAKEAALRAVLASDANRSRFAQDAYLAAFLLPKTAETKGSIPTTGTLRDLAAGVAPAAATVGAVNEIARTTPFLHWSVAFAPIMARGGFDVVLGNPPWLSFTGRQRAEVPDCYLHLLTWMYPAISRWPAAHPAFLIRGVQVLANGGHIGLVLPLQVADLEAYSAARGSVTSSARLPQAIVDVGEDAFPGVTQRVGLFNLVRLESPTNGSLDPWPSISGTSPHGALGIKIGSFESVLEDLLRDLARRPKFQAKTFADPGVHTGNVSAKIIKTCPPFDPRGWRQVREGRDISPFRCSDPRKWVWVSPDLDAGEYCRIRPIERYVEARILVRQTANRPIAARHVSPTYFRNSLLACFGVPGVSDAVLVAFLNSALYGLFHRRVTQDAAQKAFPQVKIGHLHALPGLPTEALLRPSVGGRTLGGEIEMAVLRTEAAALAGTSPTELLEELERLVLFAFDIAPSLARDLLEAVT